jgi:hypothetical protein
MKPWDLEVTHTFQTNPRKSNHFQGKIGKVSSFSDKALQKPSKTYLSHPIAMPWVGWGSNGAAPGQTFSKAAWIWRLVLLTLDEQMVVTP